jgi:hypothetical protein
MDHDQMAELAKALFHVTEATKSLVKARRALGDDPALDDEPEMDSQAEDAEPLMPGAPRLPDNSAERRIRAELIRRAMRASQ